MTDKEYMQRAIDLALLGAGHTNPNPMVGAVIVKDDRIVSEGYHEKYGDLHAERNALSKCGWKAPGATMYVTLEPCCHHGKQPPCTDAVIASGVSKVFIGSRDPNPLVSGKGVQLLRDAGIEVITDFMREACDAINPVFFHYISTGLPYVISKYAMTMDGKIATRTGASKWITGDAARQRVQEDRGRYAGIMVGIGTVLADDPLLTCRIPGKSNPVRIICDTNLRIPEDSQIVKTAKDVETIIATGSRVEDKIARLTESGCGVITLPLSEAHIDLKALMKALGERKIDSVYIEGGGKLHWSALHAGMVNKVQVFVAPKIFGGNDAPTPVSGLGCDIPDNGFMLTPPEITRYGDDILLESEVIPCSQE
ncbi:MAG: bifunctional diaminohydroxyphosphoribosylaminopyrimidine deaminase/5-amino-6-(5-phosphoribosylamino)uracil reductase RibD [Firmicutes bacterium]|nr:bifunctional diaminohydroxyphosphoribosylaminopyrimidine deaminase/5-amino-6-(5-phosphoribosylamino)uracil reductase RibD [Bacillota bacterium]